MPTIQHLDASPAILWITDAEGFCTYLNKQWYIHTGFSEQQSLGFGWLNATHPEDKARVEKIYFEANAKQLPFYTEYRLITADGHFRWAIDTGNPRYDASGKFAGYAGAVFDIHDLKTATLNLQASKEHYRLLFENSPLPKLIFDVETLKFTDVNETAVQQYGYSREEFLSMYVTEIRPHSERERLVESLKQDHLGSQTPLHKSYNHVKKDGSIIQVEVSTHDLVLDGRRCRLAAIIDVTERIAAEQRQRDLMEKMSALREEAERSRKEAENASRAKSLFLANVSHEIRTPLGIIQGFAELLTNEGSHSAEEQRKWITAIGKNAYQLTSLIDELLDLSKIEAEKLEIENIEFNLSEVIQDVAVLLEFKAKEKGIKLRVIFDGSLPKRISSDPKRLRQILINVIGNAIKFTSWGGVEVRVRILSGGRQEGPCTLQFSVKDTGIGISYAEAAKLFQPFSQADSTNTRKFGGTGLGLYISRKLARAMGGDLVLSHSRAQGGSTFIFTLQCESKDIAEFQSVSHLQFEEVDQARKKVLDGVSVLVVEDSIDNQALVERFLTMSGAKVELASNGIEGIQKALNGQHSVVLMDLQMPEIDGYEATKKLRQVGFKKPIIAFTAHAMKQERDRCLSSGFDDHISKPIQRDVLIETISSHAEV